MKIEAIDQERITSPDQQETDNEAIVETRVIIREVSSPCILSRLMIDTLGRPGIDNDMEFFHSGDRCIIVWTRPQLSLEETRALISQVIAPPGLS
jgi:hypothetical protein